MQMLLLGVLGTHSVVLCVAKLSLLPLRLYAAMPHASMPPCFYARAGLHVESLFPLQNTRAPTLKLPRSPSLLRTSRLPFRPGPHFGSSFGSSFGGF